MTAEFINAIAALIGAISWPLAVVGVVLLLRREISQLLGRLDHMNFGGTRLAFDKQMKAEIIDAAENLAESAEGAHAAPAERKLDKTMMKMVETDPTGAIVFSWKLVQDALVDLSNKHGIWLDLRSARKSAEQLCMAGAISPEMAEVIKSLYSTYKRAIHSYDFAPDQQSIEEYVFLTQEAVQAIEGRSQVGSTVPKSGSAIS
ncbi:hypothetical protein [Pseudorhizobium flavum]|uniref:hypothetical protein n=1 Tax=Pseudorhizobium flavum TaxID=1335061 RepID=UPI00376F78F5